MLMSVNRASTPLLLRQSMERLFGMSGFENLKAVVGQNFYNHRPQQFIIFCDDNPRCVIEGRGAGHSS